MTRIFATARKTLILDVVGQSVVTRTNSKATTRTFRNRYTLRRFVSSQVASALKAGYVSVNR